jgi:plasmid stabilization system protein ParE
MRVRFISQAEDEVLLATAHYLGQSGSLADEFLASVSKATDLLLQFPGIGSPVEGAARRIILKTFPYQLVYRVEGDEIRIYAVAHLKRSPGYWTTRLP